MSGIDVYDVVDENDRVVGQASHEQCHGNPPLLHRTIHYTLVNPATRSVLIVVRANNTDPAADRLGFLDEHILAGESYETAASRGVAAQLGLDVRHFYLIGDRLVQEPGVYERDKLLVALPPLGAALRINLDLIISARWEPMDQLYTLPVSAATRYWLERGNWAAAFRLAAA